MTVPVRRSPRSMVKSQPQLYELVHNIVVREFPDASRDHTPPQRLQKAIISDLANGSNFEDFGKSIYICHGAETRLPNGLQIEASIDVQIPTKRKKQKQKRFF